MVADKMETLPAGVPRLTRAEILYLIAKTHKSALEENGYAQDVRKEFYNTGVCVALDGSEDFMVSKALQLYWQREEIAEWREKYLSDIRDGVLEKPHGVAQLIATFENPHTANQPTIEEMLEGAFAEDEVVREEANAEGPGVTDPATGAEVGESVLQDRYAVTRGRKEGDDQDMEARQREEGDAKRRKLAEKGSDLLAKLPGREDSWEDKRAFSLSMSEFLQECELSPRYLKMNRVYSSKRNAQKPDQVRKEQMMDKHEKETAGIRSEMLAEEEARENYFAANRVLPEPKKRGRKKLSEQEKAKRKEVKKNRDSERYQRVKKAKNASNGEGDVQDEAGGQLVFREDREEPQTASQPNMQLVLAPHAAPHRPGSIMIEQEESDSSDWRSRLF